MAKTFREWNVEQSWLLPPSVMDFVPPDHVAHSIRETVREQLDLSEILAPYEKEERGFPPYHPVMMTALLLYAYCLGIYSSRRIAQGCEQRVDFMAVTGLNRPDFRGRMLETEKRLKQQVREWFTQADAMDTQEDRRHGRERRGDELPEWVADKQRRIAKIREAKAALEAEARAAGERVVDPKRSATSPAP